MDVETATATNGEINIQNGGGNSHRNITLQMALNRLIVCQTKRHLLALYQAATERYSQAVAALAQAIGAVSKKEYTALKMAALRTRLLSTDAVDALEAHTDEHGC